VVGTMGRPANLRHVVEIRGNRVALPCCNDPAESFGSEWNQCHMSNEMTVAEIAEELRVVLRNSVAIDTSISVHERTFFSALQNAPDEEMVTLWLSLSHLKDRHVSMAVAELWAKEAKDFSEWMALLERNT
jgi:hypothetical protein